MKRSGQDVYNIFIGAYVNVIKKPRRKVKNYDSFMNNFKYKKELLHITGLFNTIWSKIDPYLFFQTGFKQYGQQFNIKMAYIKQVQLIELVKTVMVKRNAQNRNTGGIKKSLETLVNRLTDMSISDYYLNYVLQDMVERRLTLEVFHEFVINTEYIYVELMDRGLIPDLQEIYDSCKFDKSIRTMSLSNKRKINSFIQRLI